MTRLAIISGQTRHNQDVVPPDQVQERLKVESWIADAATKGIREKFAPYLDFSAWR